jgi:hypothetical protein
LTAEEHLIAVNGSLSINLTSFAGLTLLLPNTVGNSYNAVPGVARLTMVTGLAARLRDAGMGFATSWEIELMGKG